jgi:hypothetical protein
VRKGQIRDAATENSRVAERVRFAVFETRPRADFKEKDRMLRSEAARREIDCVGSSCVELVVSIYSLGFFVLEQSSFDGVIPMLRRLLWIAE